MPPRARDVARMSHSEHFELEMFDLFSSHFPCAQLSASRHSCCICSNFGDNSRILSCLLSYDEKNGLQAWTG
jgi:hypothetical protein